MFGFDLVLGIASGAAVMLAIGLAPACRKFVFGFAATQAKASIDIAAKARADRARQLAQRRRLRSPVATDLETYMRAFKRASWSFRPSGRREGPRPATVRTSVPLRKIAASIFFLPWIVARTLFQGASWLCVSLPWMVTWTLGRLILSILLFLPWALTRKSFLMLVSLLVAVSLLVPQTREALARQAMHAALWITGPLFHGQQSVDAILRRSDCAQQQVLADADGKLVHVFPRPDCAEAERPRFRSLPVSPQVAAGLRAAFETLEGQYHVGSRTLLGVNVWGWAAAGRSYVFEDGARGGGSSPIETASKNVVDKGGRLSLHAKLLSGLVTGAVTSQMRTPEDRDLWVAMNTPCGRGASESRFGPPVAGGFCTQVLFGQDSLTHVTPAQACAWAATSLAQLLVPGEDTPQAEYAAINEHNKEIIERAEFCLRKQFTEPAQLHPHLRELSQIAATPRFNVGQRVSVTGPADPVQRLRARLAGAEFLVADQMRLERFASDAKPRLTVSSDVQQEAMPALLRALARLETKVPEFCLTNCDDSSAQADVAVAIAEIKPATLDIVAGWSNKHGLLSGRLRRDANGGFEGMPATRGVGSLNKAFLALPIGAARVSHLCNEHHRGLKNPGPRGDTGVTSCAQPGALVPLASIYAQSLNLPPLNFARGRGAAYLRDLARGFELTIKDGLDGDDLAAGFVLGTGVVATPITLMRNFAAIHAGAINGQLRVARPGLIAGSVRGSDLSLPDLGFDATAAKAAARLLQHPITHGDGTLRALAPVLSRLGCDRAIGKTGTPETEATEIARANRDKLVLAAFRCGTRDFVAFAMIGSPDIRVPLGSITTSDVVTLVEPLLSAAVRKGSRHAAR